MTSVGFVHLQDHGNHPFPDASTALQQRASPAAWHQDGLFRGVESVGLGNPRPQAPLITF